MKTALSGDTRFPRPASPLPPVYHPCANKPAAARGREPFVHGKEPCVMDCVNRITLNTPSGEKFISAVMGDVRALDEPVDVLTVSAFYGSYAPTPHTLIRALNEKKISVATLAADPEIDLRGLCKVWLSRETRDAALPVRRIGCVETSPYSWDRELWKENKENIFTSISAYFRMLEIASLSGIPTGSVWLPVLGSGSQKIEADLVIYPLLKECVGFLKSNENAKEIVLFDRDPQKVFRLAKALDDSYSLKRAGAGSAPDPGAMRDALAFISYSSKDKNIADNLCAKLESAGIRVWYAPRDTRSGDYAASIVSAISRCTHFIVILSGNSFQSHHVLNEIDLAFERLGKLRFCPLKIDEETMGPAFTYYLSTQHWMDAHVPPLEKRLDEFVEKIVRES